ncbi:hypothetical protein [Pseudomonas sp. LP_7_YM]|uniref:hypothetical protein n=1 Tax=Pseudomonas sp. LP_7_YM TaxID=2485137 RepID=UPI00105BE342|nr:hypothetical protein [Pseudomonas sp. LP_7_YM]TDV67615.1 hypothetical protein EC915_103150 [Pseudomonas sp. LP_7_YM]
MSEAKSVNGYQIKQLQDGQWWLIGHDEEHVAGPFASESSAIEVAAVFQDTPVPRHHADKRS